MDIADFTVALAVGEPGRGRRSERTQTLTKYSQQLAPVPVLPKPPYQHWMGSDRNSLERLGRILWKGDSRGCTVRLNISYSTLRETNKSACTHSMLVSQTGCPCPQHSASTLSQSKTKVINSLTLEDPPYCQSLLLVGFKVRHFWKDNLLSPGRDISRPSI